MSQPITPNWQMMTKLLSTGYTDDMFYKIMDFWDDPELVQWFHSQGYTLYNRVYIGEEPTSWVVPALPFDEVAEAIYPYAHHNAYKVTDGSIPLRAWDVSGKVVYAQDAKRRHVAIKLVLDNSEEYRILCFLREQPSDTLRANCIVPVLDMLPFFKGFWLAVMPRWGIRVTEPATHTMREILQLMHSMLTGLAFLHTNNIIHKDIKMGNVLIDHFSDDDGATYRPSYNSKGIRKFYPSPRAELRKQGRLLYGLMDFNISLMAPHGTKREEYKRPYHDAFGGSGYYPYDTAQGEFDYNPFAFDVGTLGVVFCRYYQKYTRHIPMLAPLLDKMTTWDIKNRFTAAEALHFFEEMRPDLTEEQLSVMEESRLVYGSDTFDRWQDLPEEFQRKWVSYRQPPQPSTMKVLRAVHSCRYMPYYLIPSIRWFFFKFTSAPRFIWTHFLAFVGFR